MSLILGALGLLGGGGVLTFLLGPARVLGALRQALGIVRDLLGWLFRTPAAMAILLAAALLFGVLQWSDARHWRKLDASDAAGRASAERGLANERAAHAITRASLEGAKGQITDNNRRIEAAAAELARQRTQWASDKARLDARYRHTAATIADLEADARRTDTDPCTVSDAAKRALEGL